MPKVTSSTKEDTKLWEKFKKKLEGIAKKEPGVKIGVFQTAGMHDEKSEMSTVEVAAIHEFGSPAANIPERSFLRHPIQAKKGSINKLSTKLVKAVVDDKITVDTALSVLGQYAVSVSKAAIVDGDGIPPPLQPETIRRKHSSRPLVDTGKLVNSITYQVVGTEEESSGGGPEGGAQDGSGGTDAAVESGED